MSNRIKQKAKSAVPMTETQKHIKELREKLNKTDPNEIRHFTVYKILTYLCVLILPLVPVALFCIWRPKTEFTQKEKLIWTSVIAVIAVYAVMIPFG